jgi:hypothetical protein
VGGGAFQFIQLGRGALAGRAARRATVRRMPAFGKIWVMDREAYLERRAVMEVEGVNGLEASRVSSDYAYRSRMGVVLTAAANDDWEPAHAWWRLPLASAVWWLAR